MTEDQPEAGTNMEATAPTDEGLTLEEAASKKALQTACEHLGGAMQKLMGNGNPMLGFQANQHISGAQLDALVELLFLKGVIKREEFWGTATKSVQATEAEYRRAALNQSLIQPANGFRPGHSPKNPKGN